MEQGKPYASSLSEESYLRLLASLCQPQHLPVDPDLVIESSVSPYRLGILPQALDGMELSVLLLTVGSCPLKNLPHISGIRTGR